MLPCIFFRKNQNVFDLQVAASPLCFEQAVQDLPTGGMHACRFVREPRNLPTYLRDSLSISQDLSR